MGMHQDLDNQRREYSRVAAYIPFEYRIVSPEEKQHLQARILDDTTSVENVSFPDRGDHDPILGEWLKILNLKLDMIIRLMTLQREGYFGLSFKAVNISGGGLSFSSAQEIPLGEILEIKMILKLQQPVELCIYGEVVKVENCTDGYFIAVHHIYMDDFIRDVIVRFVFEREREIIREKRR